MIELGHMQPLMRPGAWTDHGFWIWLAGEIEHDRVPELACFPRETLDMLAMLLRAEAGPFGAH
jgi:hypothetical protein